MIATVQQQPAGPGDELSALFAEHYRPLVRLAALLVDDVGRCEELVQEAFAQVLVHREGVRDPHRLAAYLRSAVLNGARSELRKRATAQRHLRAVRDDEPGPEATVLRHDDDHAVLLALRSLPDRQRDVLVLRYWLELPEHEIADALGISPGTVKTHAKRGLEHLASTLEDRR